VSVWRAAALRSTSNEILRQVELTSARQHLGWQLKKENSSPTREKNIARKDENVTVERNALKAGLAHCRRSAPATFQDRPG